MGINFDSRGTLCGDVNFDEVEPVVDAITPVPGGIGTVTTSVTMAHVVDAAEKMAGQVGPLCGGLSRARFASRRRAIGGLAP